MATTTGCQENQGLLQVLVEGGLSAGERASVEAHMAGCPACTAEGARLQANTDFLKETFAPLRMPADLTPEFLLALPPKDPRRKAPAPAAAAAPRTLVLGDTRPRGTSPWKVIGGLAFLGAAGGLGWLFLADHEPPAKRSGPAPIPGVTDRAPPGQGPADARKIEKPVFRPQNPPPGGKTALPSPGEPVRSAAELAERLRGLKGGDAFLSAVKRGWDLVATNPAEAKAVRDLAAKEKDPAVRAGLVACLGADGADENRTALRGFLGDESADVRTAAALALGRSLSIDKPRNLLPSGPPLGLFIDVGPMADDPARADLAARLSVESDPGVKRVLISVLGPTASAEVTIRDRVLEGVKGAFGEETVEPSVRALQGLKDPAVVEACGAALADGRTPAALHRLLLETMAGADEAAAGEKFTALFGAAQAPEVRKELLGALAKLGGATTQKTCTDALAGDVDAGVRVLAATSLQKYPSKEVLDALQKAAENDADQAVRQEAERVARGMKAVVEKPEGNGENPPPVDNPAPDGR